LKKASGERDEVQVVGGGESEEEAARFLQLRKIKVLQFVGFARSMMLHA
jgi:hypothetical protein